MHGLMTASSSFSSIPLCFSFQNEGGPDHALCTVEHTHTHTHTRRESLRWFSSRPTKKWRIKIRERKKQYSEHTSSSSDCFLLLLSRLFCFSRLLLATFTKLRNTHTQDATDTQSESRSRHNFCFIFIFLKRIFIFVRKKKLKVVE
jgi:hypothetical protein